MRKLVVTMFVSLDGVVESPMWTFPYWSDEIAAYKGEEQDASDTMLLGRVTYEGFAGVWPSRSEPGSEYMNNTRKVVVTQTLTTLDWNNSHRLTGDVAAGVQALKAEAGANILVYGSAQLVQALVQHNLVDEYRLLIYPVVVGTGTKLFHEGTQATLRLIEARTSDMGVLMTRYVPAQ